MQVGSEDIDSGEESSSGRDDGSDREGDGAGPSESTAHADASKEEEDEVGDLSWEAVMAAVQGGGSDDDADEQEIEPAPAAGLEQAQPTSPLPKTTRIKATKQSIAAAGSSRKKVQKSKQRSSQLGKRQR